MTNWEFLRSLSAESFAAIASNDIAAQERYEEDVEICPIYTFNIPYEDQEDSPELNLLHWLNQERGEA